MLLGKRRIGSLIGKGFALLIVVVFSVLVLSPTGCYLSRAAWEEAKILGGRENITELISGPESRKIDSITKKKLEIVAAARLYAKDSIGLKTGESYTMYSDIGRDTLLLVLSAAYKDKLERYTWWFPIVGTVPYKGYFNFKDARKAEEKLAAEGYDTYLRPSDAFSTLGFFNDPLLNTTLQADSLTLANTVIHEVTHNTFYAAGQATFNESFANFVGARGSAAFFRSRGQERAAQITELRWEDQKVLGDFWTALSARLDSAFAAHSDSVGPEGKEARMAAREIVYAKARQSLIDSIGPLLKTYPEAYVKNVRLDNASLLARRVYAMELGLFDRVWEIERRDIKRTIARVVQLAESRKSDPFAAVREWVKARGGE